MFFLGQNVSKLAEARNFFEWLFKLSLFLSFLFLSLFQWRFCQLPIAVSRTFFSSMLILLSDLLSSHEHNDRNFDSLASYEIIIGAFCDIESYLNQF